MPLFVKFACKQRGTLLLMFQVSKKLNWQLFRIVSGRPVAMKNGVSWGNGLATSDANTKTVP